METKTDKSVVNYLVVGNKFGIDYYIPCRDERHAERRIDEQKKIMHTLLGVSPKLRYKDFDILKLTGIDDPYVVYTSIKNDKKYIVAHSLALIDADKMGVEIEINKRNNITFPMLFAIRKFIKKVKLYFFQRILIRKCINYGGK